MLLGDQGFAPMELDVSRNLIGICGAVAQSRIHQRACERRILDERRQRIRLLGEIIDPHRDLPHVGATEQPGAPTGRPIAKHDQRMLLATGAFLGIATQTI
jgi:hypothetical protein